MTFLKDSRIGKTYRILRQPIVSSFRVVVRNQIASMERYWDGITLMCCWLIYEDFCDLRTNRRTLKAPAAYPRSMFMAYLITTWILRQNQSTTQLIGAAEMGENAGCEWVYDIGGC